VCNQFKEHGRLVRATGFYLKQSFACLSTPFLPHSFTLPERDFPAIFSQFFPQAPAPLAPGEAREVVVSPFAEPI
jgi:hypothetical protein